MLGRTDQGAVIAPMDDAWATHTTDSAGTGSNVAIDDFSHLAYADELPNESPATTADFLHRAWRF